MSKLATGRRAWFTCQRCGLRGRYTESVADGQNPNLRVHASCRDIKHPAEQPFTAEDGISLAHPIPDLDTVSAGGGSGATLINNLPPLTGGTFGGAT